MQQPTTFYNDQFLHLINNDGRQNIEPFPEQDSNIGAESSGADLQRASYGLPPSIHPLALHQSEPKQIPQSQDALNLMPGMSMSQQLPAQKYSAGGPTFGAPDPRYDLQAQHPLHDGYLVDTHGSYNFGNLPKPSFPNYGHLPQPAEARTLPSSIASPSGIPLGSSSSATLSPISPSLGPPSHEGFSSPIGTFTRHDIVGHHHLSDLAPSPRSHFLPMSGKHNLTGHYGGYSNSIDMDTASNSSRGGSESLPFQETKASAALCDAHSRTVNPEIHAKIDKGFFQADGDWTCYRRNYFAVACSYKLKLENGSDAPTPVYLRNKNGRAVDKFAMCIAACIDNDETKTIELVQHTPKRDKGPVTPPEKKILQPNPSGQLGSLPSSSSVGAYGPSSPFHSHQQEGGYYPGTPITSPPPPPPADEHLTTTYERIQFKKATANNGKRRAAQQYFYILVELYAGFRKSASQGRSSASVNDHEWHKVAVRMSAQMVVRGRSPGHYSDGNARPSSSMGPGPNMGGGDGGSGGYIGMAGPGHGPMGSSAYPGPHRMYPGTGYSHGGQYGRGMMQISDSLDLVPSLSSCSTLDDSSVNGDGAAAMSAQPPYSLYGGGISQVPGLMSPQFPLPTSTSSAGTPRMQMAGPAASYKPLTGAQNGEFKSDGSWQRRDDYPGGYRAQRFDPNANTNQSYLNSNDTFLRDCRPSWQAPANDLNRGKWEPMPT